MVVLNSLRILADLQRQDRLQAEQQDEQADDGREDRPFDEDIEHGGLALLQRYLFQAGASVSSLTDAPPGCRCRASSWPDVTTTSPAFRLIFDDDMAVAPLAGFHDAAFDGLDGLALVAFSVCVTT